MYKTITLQSFNTGVKRNSLLEEGTYILNIWKQCAQGKIAHKK
jgi:hypothetical protein